MERITINVQFDGQVFRPESPVDLPTAGRFRAIIESIPEPPETLGLLEVLDRYAGSFEGPGDLSANLDHYLYGTPKAKDGDD